MADRRLIGVIGHVDHGKTALVRALTGMETDRLPEERRRGISIALGFAHCTQGAIELDFVDMPGHERFVRTMVSGATGISQALLVVAATDGIKPQTREHIEIARLLGLTHAVIAISKTDLAPAQAPTVAVQALALTRAAGLTAPPPILTSATTGLGLDALLTALAATPSLPPSDSGFAYLPIDRAFSLPGHGTIVTGTLRRGPLATGDEIELLAPTPRLLRIRALQTHRARTPTATPGQRVAVNLRNIEVAEIPRGAALATPTLLTPSTWLTIHLQATADAPPLPTTTRLRLLIGTAELSARLRLLDRDTLEPSASALAQLQITPPIALPARERFVLRTPSPPLTIAGGIILDPAATRLRRHDEPSLAHLQALATATPAETIAHTLAAAAAQGVPLPRLARLAALSPARATAILQTQPVHIGRTVVTRDTFATLLTRIPPLLAQSLPRDRLAALLPDASPPVLDAAIAALLTTNRLRQTGPLLELPHPAQDAARATQVARLAETFRTAGLTPPDPTPEARRLLEALIRRGTLVRTTDRVQKREILFHRDAVAAAQHRLAPLLAPPGLLVKDAGAALGISRKYSVPLLEHLDSTGFTCRVDARRVLGKPPA